ncbi:MAG: PAS domain S-box protein [Chloroflexi bacterium]|nr:PAS domain S-box protein [Chloroflexota bacterium]
MMPDPQPTSFKGDILIVDDALTNLRVLSNMLEKHKFKVRGAPNGPTALMMIDAEPPDLILLDIRMPEMDGYEICRRLKADEKTRDIPVIFISAATELTDKMQGFAVGGVDYITKPIQVEEVLARVETHLTLRTLQAQLEEQNAQLLNVNDRLTSEINGRKQAEIALQRAHNELEQRVRERTAELAKVNTNLKSEINERTRMEKQLGTLSSVIEQSASSIAILDTQGKIEYANPKLLELYQHTPEQVIGTYWRSFVSMHSTLRENLAEIKNTVIEKGMMWKGEVTDRAKNGQVIWRETTIFPVKDEKGKITHFVYTSDDITERKQAEEGQSKALTEALEATRALRESEHKFRSMIEQSLDGIMLTDEKGIVVEWNPGQEQITGITRDQAVGRPLWDIQVQLTPDHRRTSEYSNHVKTFTLEFFSTGQASWSGQLLEIDMQRPDRAYRTVQQMVFPIKTDRGFRVASTLRDVTERKRTERLLQVLNQASLATGKALTHDEIFSIVAEEFKALDYYCMIFPTDEDQNRLFTRYASFDLGLIEIAEKMTGIDHKNFSFPIENVDVYRKVIWDRQTALIVGDDVMQQVLSGPLKKIAGQLVETIKIPKSITAPLIAEDMVIGALAVHSDDLTEDDIPAINAFAHQVAAAWRRAQLFEQAQQEIIERKRAEGALRESEEKYRNLFEHANDALFIMDVSKEYGARYLDCNERTLGLFGCSHRDQIIGKSPQDFSPPTQPDGQSSGEKIRELALSVMQSYLQSFEWMHHRLDDGRPFWVEVHLNHLELKGEVFIQAVVRDITERKQAEEALRASEEKFSKAFHSSPSVIGLSSLKDGRYMDVNESFLRVLGYDRAEAIGHTSTNLDIFVNPKDRERLAQIIKEHGSLRNVEAEFRTKTREIRTGSFSAEPIEVEGEQCLLAVMDDITDRKQAEEGQRKALADKETALAEVSQATHALRQRNRELALLNQAGQAFSSTLKLDQVLDVLLEEVRHLMDVVACLVWLVESESSGLICQHVIGPQSEIVRDWRLPPGTGFAGWVANSGESLIVPDAQVDERHYEEIDQQTGLPLRSILSIPLWVKDHIIGVLQIVDTRVDRFDVTDLELLEPLAANAAIAIENAQLYEETSRRLAETNVLQNVMLAAAATLDFDQVLIRAIQSIRRTLNIEYVNLVLPDESGEHLVVHPSLVGFAPPVGEDIRLPLEGSVCGQVYTTGQPVLIRNTLQSPDYFELVSGLASELCVPVQVDSRIIAILNAESPEPDAFTKDDLHLFEAIAAQLGTVMKNAQVYEAEREQRKLVEQSQAQLVQSEKLAATGRLSASLAHEINNPLQAIHNSLQLVLGFPLEPEEEREYLRMADEEVERLVEIVTRILEFARPSRRGKQPIEINDTVEKTLALTGKYFQHRHITIRRHLADGLPPVAAVSGELEQVFLNILLNAVDAMPNGGSLHVSSYLVEDDRLTVSFSDSGVGIPPEHLGRIFEPFFSTKEGGTGLGLSISHGMIEQHGGEITVQSTAGEGTTFTVWLPVLPA